MSRILMIFSLIFLTACAKQSSYGQYDTMDAGQSSVVEFGTILASRPIQITGQATGGGQFAGGALGAAAGSTLGGGRGRVLTTVGGAVAGAIAGNMAEQAIQDSQGVEYTIVKENGSAITIAQRLQDGEPVLANGSRVIVQTSGTYKRVLPANALPTNISRPQGITVY